MKISKKEMHEEEFQCDLRRLKIEVRGVGGGGGGCRPDDDDDDDDEDGEVFKEFTFDCDDDANVDNEDGDGFPVGFVDILDSKEHAKTLRSRITKNPDVNTGPLVCPFACSLAPLARSITPELVGK